MKRKNIYITALLLIGLALVACNKQLNVYPTTSEVDGNVIHDTKSAQTVLNGVYYRFANGSVDYNNNPTIKWQDVNENLPSGLAGTLNYSGGGSSAFTLTLTPADYNAGTIWTYGYQLVNAANGFLKNIGPATTIPTATKNQLTSEGRFLRAFGNAELLLYYGQYYDATSKYGIILRDTFVTSNNIVQARASVADCYTSIIADLDYAIANLPAQTSQIFYANASAAKILKAQVLINRGASGDYATVVSLMNDVISNGPFSLEGNQKDIFLTNGASSKEVILACSPFPAQTFKWQEYQYYGQFTATDALTSLMANDPRNQWVYKHDPGGSIYGRYYPVDEVTKYYSGPLVNPANTPLSENCYAFRLSEAYLLEAEALCLSSGDLSQAKSLLKTVEAHAGITDFSDVDAATSAAELQVLVVKEDIKNFFCENGADWFALRRLPLATAQTIQPALKSAVQLIMPIPLAEISTNAKCVQNPGY